MLVLLFGGNELAIQRRLAELREQADGGSGMLESNTNLIDGRDTKPNDIISPAMAVPFLAPHRLVLVEHFLERFEARDGQRGARSISAFDPLFAALESGLPETTMLVFVGLPFRSQYDRRISVSAKNPMVARLAKVPGALVEEKPGIAAKHMPEFIRGEAKRYGLTFRPGKHANRLAPGEVLPEESDPAVLLANLINDDTLSLANELEKLRLYTGGGEITVAEVNRVCSGERQADNFKFRDAVLDGRLGRALETYSLIHRDGQSTQGLLVALADGYRQLALILDALEDGANNVEIGKLMGKAGSFPGLRDAAIRRARNLGRERLRHAFAAIVEADRQTKTGEVNDEVAFDVLLARLCDLAAPARR